MYKRFLLLFDILSRCIFHVVDAYGTKAEYNHPQYSVIHGYESFYGGLGLDLKQFYTFFRKCNSYIVFCLQAFNKLYISLLGLYFLNFSSYC